MVGFLFLVVFVFLSVTLLSKKRATMAAVNRDDSKEGGLNSRSWSFLPVDILNEIIDRLYIVDQIRFRATCKSWQLAHSVRPADKLPWLMTHNWNWDNHGNIISKSKYHYPTLNQTFINEHKLRADTWQDIFGASVCASKYGWLLLQRSEKPFLYNAFTKEVVKLPNMGITFNRSTFSSSPNLPDCVVFAVQSCKSSMEIILNIWRCGDPEWEMQTVTGFHRVIEDVVYSSGTFYCVFSGGVLGAYSIALQEWKLLTNMEPIMGITFRYRVQMAESDGQLLLICPPVPLRIFQFDWSQMAWVEQYSLGKKALFLGCTSFSVPAAEESSDLADKIYYHGDITYSYSLKTRRNCQCSELYPWVTERGAERIWIEPPQL